MYNKGMAGGLQKITVSTSQSRQVVDITDEVVEYIDPDSNFCTLFVAHTTCALTTVDLDAGTDRDLLDAAWEMIPKLRYRHAHDPEHAPAHLASSFIGPNLCVPVADGKLVLGTWQRIVLVELDGPRDRLIVIA